MKLATTPRAVGMTLSAILGVSVSLRHVDDVVTDVATKPEVRYVGLSTGRYEVIIEAFFNDQEHLLEFVTKDLGHLEGVTQVESSIILRVAKFSYEWEVPIGWLASIDRYRRAPTSNGPLRGPAL